VLAPGPTKSVEQRQPHTVVFQNQTRSIASAATSGVKSGLSILAAAANARNGCRSSFSKTLEPCSFQKRFYSSGEGEILVPVPSMGDSITEGTVVSWLKGVGEHVNQDETIVQIETDKVTVDVRAPESGVITSTRAESGATVVVGTPLATIRRGPPSETAAAPVSKPAASEADVVAEAPRAIPVPQEKTQAAPFTMAKSPEASSEASAAAAAVRPVDSSREKRVPMSRMRRRIADRLKDAQNTAAMLTTFNEIDMTNLMELREKYKEDFQKKHNVKLGFMSAFIKASSSVLMEMPNVNAVIDGNDILYRDYVDVSVAVATPTGLVVPVLRNADRLTFVEIEKAILALGEKARTNQLAVEDMAGGTFTISNGGVYGSLLSTPIINLPQSAILGMHAINKRPIAINDQVVVRPMMYVALSYDHRLIDGREAVTFLKRIKDLVEDPRRLLLDL